MKAITDLNTVTNFDDYQDYTVDQLMREIGQLRRHVERQQYAIHKLQKEANEDELTGLPNRRSFNLALKQALTDYKRYNHAGAVVLIDVNDFKIVNDTLGHLVGDKVLQHVSNVLNKHVRETDMVARLGGDEFIILLREVDAKEARIKAKEFMEVIAATPCNTGGHTVQVGISAGACAFHQQANEKSIVLNADAEMYRVKIAGKE
jgi:diguanylate cyclase (GGDEF)-like protein